jgi:hypothetical protein
MAKKNLGELEAEFPHCLILQPKKMLLKLRKLPRSQKMKR